MAKSTKSHPIRKSLKPYPEFPLTAHPSGRWCKKRRGRQHYFGPINVDGDFEVAWKAAYQRYEREWPHILDGREPPPDGAEDGLTMAALCNEFLNSKRRQMDAGELSSRTWDDYRKTTDGLIAQFGGHRRVDDLRPDDFQTFRSKLAKRLGVVSVKNEVNRCRTVFKFASDQRLIERPVYYGQSFDRPSKKTIRKGRIEAGIRLFESDELRKILSACDPVMRALVLLGANCGFGNTDVANLPQSAVDLDEGWIEFPRPKTAIERRCPIWPETVEALRVAIPQRPEPKDKDDADCCFLTKRGNRWAGMVETEGDKPRMVKRDNVTVRFGKLLRKLNINGRPGLGFYTLRHVFQTIGGEAKDPEAVAAIMGHVDTSMGAVYRERISDERLRDVVEIVREWLWPDDTGDDSK